MAKKVGDSASVNTPMGKVTGKVVAIRGNDAVVRVKIGGNEKDVKVPLSSL